VHWKKPELAAGRQVWLQARWVGERDGKV